MRRPFGVDREDLNRSATNRSFADDARAIYFKVVGPPVPARVEESDKLTCVWIHPGNVRPFMPIAVRTGEGEVRQLRFPVMLPSNHMVNLKRQRQSEPREAAILTTFPCTFPDLPAQLPIHW